MFENKHKIESFKKKIWLSSPTMHGEELKYVQEAYNTNWMSTVGENINAIEDTICRDIGCKYSVGLSTGTAALHLAVKLSGVKPGDKVFCSDLTFSASANPITYEGGTPIFIDSEDDTWNMDPKALEKAFDLYPDVRVVMLVHLYGTPAKVDEIKNICSKHNALLIEDAAEALGATYKGVPVGNLGDIGCISFNGNKIITGSAGGMLLTDDKQTANKARKLSTQARENAPWYQHEEIGYNYRISNVIAGVVRGQLPYLAEHVSQKKEIYERYKSGLKNLPIKMNPVDVENSESNYWLSCLTVNEEAMCKQVRSDNKALYNKKSGKTCPTEILETLSLFNAEGRPIWKPMHVQPVFRMHDFITREGNARGVTNAYIAGGDLGKDGKPMSIGADIFERGLCLPSDIKMTIEEQDKIIKIICCCFE